MNESIDCSLREVSLESPFPPSAAIAPSALRHSRFDRVPVPVASVVPGALAGLLVIPQALLLAHVIDALFLQASSLSGIAGPISGFAALSAARACLTWMGDVRASGHAAAVKRSTRVSVAARVLAVGPRWLDRQRTGALTSTLAAGLEALDAYMAAYQPQAVLAVVVPPAVLIAVALVDPLSGLVLAVTGPLIPVFMWLLGGIARERTTRQWRDLARLSARFLDAVQGLVTLRAFGRVDAEVGTLRTASNRFRVLTMEVLRVAFLSSLALELLATLGTAIVAVEVGLRLLYGWLPFADALAVLLLAPEFYRPLRALGASFHAGMAGREAMRQVQHFEDTLPAEDVGHRHERPAPLDAAPELTFDHVAVGYDGRPLTFEGLSFTIAPGELVGVAGASGAGKTTLLALLLRFRTPEAGAILVNGLPIDRWPPDVWRRAISWAPQRPHLFEGSVRQNLCLGHPSATAEEVSNAVRLAAFDEVIAGLPQGLDTPIGERGMSLSGGEAQRLALARAYLKHAPLLLLDEPTSELDGDTEQRVLDGLSEVRKGRTTLLVSHRTTTMNVADRVVTVAAGRVSA